MLMAFAAVLRAPAPPSTPLVAAPAIVTIPTPTTPVTPTPPSRNSKRAATEIELPAYNPPLEAWLLGLDADPDRGKFNLNFSQFHPIFQKESLVELSDLVGLTTDKVEALGGQAMNFGIANRLARYATEDYVPPAKRPRLA